MWLLPQLQLQHQLLWHQRRRDLRRLWSCPRRQSVLPEATREFPCRLCPALLQVPGRRRPRRGCRGRSQTIARRRRLPFCLLLRICRHPRLTFRTERGRDIGPLLLRQCIRCPRLLRHFRQRLLLPSQCLRLLLGQDRPLCRPRRLLLFQRSRLRPPWKCRLAAVPRKA